MATGTAAALGAPSEGAEPFLRQLPGKVEAAQHTAHETASETYEAAEETYEAAAVKVSEFVAEVDNSCHGAGGCRLFPNGFAGFLCRGLG